MKKNIYFWGCQIPARFPFIEKATREALQILGVEAEDIDGFTCCPERYTAQSLGVETWLLTACRNLAVAETAGGDNLIAPCNGCYATLRSAAREINISPQLKARVNQALKQHHVYYTGRIKVSHLLEFLFSDIGADIISRKLSAPLWGMKIAVHYGCHLLRPGEAAGFDDPQHPGKFETLIKALGADCLDYTSKLLCCGESLGRGCQPEQATALARKKLLELHELGADAIGVACPACFLQYDTQQYLLRRQGDPFNIPVFHYSELLGLALGINPDEMGFGMHRIRTDDFLSAHKERSLNLALIEKYFDLESLKRCHQCGACENDCPAALNVPKFEPQRIIGQVLAGKIDELLLQAEIWHCVECHTCTNLCPQKFGMEQVFNTLKHLAVSKNIIPDTLKSMLDLFSTTAKLGQPQSTLRKRLNLPPVKNSGFNEWKEFLEKSKK
jgi:CoB--CoM heterodisulfide reductase subunit B